ncbi:MAG: hypothetical protein IPO58_01865 [Betaproteobacteria bacterium]|nr:hypothetical protein [Betaproteobacteria bacterium]
MCPRSLFLSWFAPALLLALGSIPAGAQIPHLLNYQGYLVDAASQPVNATVTMTFKLYGAAVGGSALFTESQSVTVSNGIFDAAIGAVTALTLPFDVPYFLGVTVSPDTEMTPRQAVLASPYALRAAGVDATAVLPGAQITGSITVATLPATQLSGTVGTAQIANSAVTPAKLSANYAGSASAGGPSTTALALNANGGNCAPGQFASGVDAQGNAEGCAAPPQGTVTSVGTGAGLTGGPITGSGTIAIDPASATLTGNFFRQGGNAFGALANTTAILGTNDGNALDVRVNGGRALRIEPNATSPNLIGGNAFNGVGANKVGSVVAGGGQLAIALNGVDANFGVVGAALATP